tara:strand:- start:69 stop:578 length:510 start_codon:yes stop_codon:yes gene_type:complete
MSKIFFFSNNKNQKDNLFVNNLIDKLKIKVVKICVDNRNIPNIPSTPCMKINNKILNKNDSLKYLATIQKKQNNVVNNPQPINNIQTPNTFDTLEMNNFSDSYSFLGNDNPLQSKYEYVSNNNNSPPPPNNLNTINSQNLSISNEKKKFNQNNYEDYLQQRNNDPYVKK